MDTNQIIKRAKFLNYLEIGVTLTAFFVLRALQSAAKKGITPTILTINYAVLIIMGIVSVFVIVMSAILMKNNQKRVKGLGLILASGIVTLIFSILGIMIGLIVWILSGVSLTKLNQTGAENDFEARLQEESNTVEIQEEKTTDQM